jgi:hypothetical protein
MPADLYLAHAVTEAELRRFLRHASTLLAASEAAVKRDDTRIFLLRRAHHWLRAALAGVEQLLRNADALPNEKADEALTTGMVRPTIERDP